MSEHELRWQLRQLPREIEPERDLWPGLASRLPGQHGRREKTWPWVAGLALAASLALAVILAPDLSPSAARIDASARNLQAELVEKEAEALTREYQAALRQLETAPVPAPLQPALQSLDQGAVDIRAAIAADPGSAFLLQQLQRTYARRLSLTQRAVTG